jgi:hypothetical protein
VKRSRPRGASRPKRHVPLIMGLIGLSIAAAFLFGFSGWWRYIPATMLLAYGVFSLRLAIFGRDAEVRELTGDAPISKRSEFHRHL